MEVLVLESVGSCIDKEGIVYPLSHPDDEIPKFDECLGCYLEDIADEWLECLSIEDTRLLHKWLMYDLICTIEDVNNKGKEEKYE